MENEECKMRIMVEVRENEKKKETGGGKGLRLVLIFICYDPYDPRDIISISNSV